MYLPSVHCGNPPYHGPKKSTLKYSGQVTAFVIIKIYMKFQPISMGKKWFYDHMCFFEFLNDFGNSHYIIKN